MRLFVLIIVSILLCITFSTNTTAQNNSTIRINKVKLPIMSEGHYKVGKPYKKNGKVYIPKRVSKNFQQVGYASWYNCKSGNCKTANSDTFNSLYLTAAHQILPMPSIIRVTNLQNNRTLILMVNDRGPFAKHRILDVSSYSAELLGFKRQGVTKVKIELMHSETQKLLNMVLFNTPKRIMAKNSLHSTNYYIKSLNIKYRTSYFTQQATVKKKENFI
ncbi:rare lipoA family protein [Orientia chuto str. Dubai]|uniref:Endolytic peptidoglycan transglycosylase RlpA n=1 Tax=Orientia chuto str. Dubai TaxID=1359168 RepID=A0A0F3MML5_9RICK|nr:septal ring lytic transglycosylase RlpA family protein [Candidatus Orientia mediorientalis]KJV56901.1 rare lipoA family protein [Orientia chuto str. Dubai]